MTSLPPMQFAGAEVLRDGALRREPLALRAGRIVDERLPEVDLSGYLVLPGIVDLNFGALEGFIQGAGDQDLGLVRALDTAERHAAMHGITTAWVSQGWSWEGGFSAPDLACDVLDTLDDMRHRMAIDLRVGLRVETHLTQDRERLIAEVAAHDVELVIFTNRVPEAIQMSARAAHKLAAWAEREGRSVEDFIARLRAAKDCAPDVPRHLLALAESFDAFGVVYGSQDDPDGETREQMRLIGARIAEFPLRAGAAAVAKANGDPILLSAQDVTRSGSRPGCVSTMALITKGACDALVSQDQPAALSDAAFLLAGAGARDLAESWSMVSERPARIMKLADRGRIAAGLRADLAIVNKSTMRIEATISEGRVGYMSGEAVSRFLGASLGMALAAE